MANCSFNWILNCPHRHFPPSQPFTGCSECKPLVSRARNVPSFFGIIKYLLSLCRPKGEGLSYSCSRDRKRKCDAMRQGNQEAQAIRAPTWKLSEKAIRAKQWEPRGKWGVRTKGLGRTMLSLQTWYYGAAMCKMQASTKIPAGSWQ